MANEKPEEKTKQTVPQMVRTPKGVADHAHAMQEREWDKERKVFRNPVTAMLALFTYAKLTAALLDEEGARIMLELRASEKRLEKRIAELETRLTTVERWKDEAEAQTAEMVKAAEQMMSGGPEAFKQHLLSLVPPAAPGGALPPVADAEPAQKPNGERPQGDVA